MDPNTPDPERGDGRDDRDGRDGRSGRSGRSGGSLERLSHGFTGLGHSIHKTIIYITEPLSPLSPTRSDSDIESGPPTPGLEKFRRWSTIRRSVDTGLPSLAVTRPPTPPEPRSLMNIPPELQILVLSFFEFTDIENLRRTCKYWYNFATPRLVRSIWGPDTFRAMLIQHCRVCLTFCPRDVTRLYTTRLDAGFPLSSRCVRCTVQAQDGTVRIGKKVKLGNFTDCWTCRWCGWPITTDASTGHVQFHRRCYDKYAVVLLAFFVLGWIQFSIGLVASGLAWHYYSRDRLMLGPTIAGFLLTWLCIILIMFRGNRVRTYHWALFIELLIVGMWTPPIYSISKKFMSGPVAISMQATMAFIGLNMLFRILNIIGNIVLICEYDRTKHYVPRIPIWRRFMNPILTALIFWTYPQHTERKVPPDWN